MHKDKLKDNYERATSREDAERKLGLSVDGCTNGTRDFAIRKALEKPNLSWEERRKIYNFYSSPIIPFLPAIVLLGVASVPMTIAIYNSASLSNDQDDYNIEQEQEDEFNKELESGKYSKEELIKIREDITLYLNEENPKVKIK